MATQRQYAVLGPLAGGVESRAFLGCEVIAGAPKPDSPVVIVWLPDDVAKDPRQVSRLQRETAFVTQLRHANINRVHGLECFEEGWARVLVYEDGEQLSRALAKLRENDRNLEPLHAARIMVDACAAVHFAHEEGLAKYAGRPIVHGGLRPDNIFLTFEGYAQVAGYGAATLASTPAYAYLAPEQIIGGKATASPSTDTYALGAILYELLAGKAPFADAPDIERAVLTGDPPRIEEPGLSGRLGNIATTAMAKRGSDRFESAGVMRDAIITALQGEELPTHEVMARFFTGLFPQGSSERMKRKSLLESARDPDSVSILSRPSKTPSGVDAQLFEAARPPPVSTTSGAIVDPAEFGEDAARAGREEKTMVDVKVPFNADSAPRGAVPNSMADEAPTEAASRDPRALGEDLSNERTGESAATEVVASEPPPEPGSWESMIAQAAQVAAHAAQTQRAEPRPAVAVPAQIAQDSILSQPTPISHRDSILAQPTPIATRHSFETAPTQQSVPMSPVMPMPQIQPMPPPGQSFLHAQSPGQPTQAHAQSQHAQPQALHGQAVQSQHAQPQQPTHAQSPTHGQPLHAQSPTHGQPLHAQSPTHGQPQHTHGQPQALHAPGQPLHAQPQPGYAMPQPAYGQPPHSISQTHGQPPQYGQPPHSISQTHGQPPQYGQPQQSISQTHGQPQYGQPPHSISQTHGQPQYGQPPHSISQTHGQPPQYGQPPQSISQTHGQPPMYGQPTPHAMTPSQTHGQPMYGQPPQTPGQPMYGQQSVQSGVQHSLPQPQHAMAPQALPSFTPMPSNVTQPAPSQAPRNGQRAPGAIPRAPMREQSAITNFDRKVGDSSRSVLIVVLIAAAALLAGVFFWTEAPPEVQLAAQEETRHALPKDLVREALEKAQPTPVVEEVPAEEAPAVDAAAPNGTQEAAPSDAPPVPQIGKLELSTDPEVDVYFGNDRLGRTPLSAKLPAGNQRIRFTDKKTGLNVYKTYRIRPAGEVRDHISFGTSELIIEAPDGASILLNSRFIGTAPLEPVKIYEGRYHLKVTMDGKSWADNFEAPPGRKINYKVTLNK